ncbi:hypothetical protein F511_32675 [Dorcoceras hygrometricum]|uniref:Uncharacterized protein n=1 Tax=Dorcoceras hygrometricum TaxID=472368 RepID=A0A2Z7CJW4_9LAMI|nr:hypothetical protein F511_32675 [Dorcoceras hygrometricum]
MVKRLETSPHDPLGITDNACKNQSVMVSVQYGPFNTYIPIRSTTIGKSRVARDPITMHTSWRSNSDIACVTRKHCDVLSMQIDSEPPPPPPPVPRRKVVSGQLDEENPFVQNSSVLLLQADEGVSALVMDRIGRAEFVSASLQADEGVSALVMDRIGDIYHNLPRRADVIVTTVGARHKCQQGNRLKHPMTVVVCFELFVLIVSRLYFYVLPLPRRGADPDHQQGYPRTKSSGESSTMKHRLLHASGPHPIPPPDDPN